MEVKFSNLLQKAILCAVGLQRKNLAELAAELKAERSQIFGLFKRILKNVSNYLNEVNKATVREQVVSQVESFVEKEKELLKDRKRSKEQIKAIENLEKDYAVDNKKTKLSEQEEKGVKENTKS